ncbi:MAG: FliI/YscN family ATPase [Phycisphaerales bacterium]
MTILAPEIETARGLSTLTARGQIALLKGLTLHADDLPLPIGSLVRVHAPSETPERGALAEVVGFTPEHTILMLLGNSTGIRPGDAVTGRAAAPTIPVGVRMLGRVVDGLGRPIDRAGPIHATVRRALSPAPIAPLRRRRINQPLHTGVRAIDLCTTLGKGQRIGIFAGPGVGKSSLLADIAKGSTADVAVIALIGERGREVGDFIAHTLGPEGLARAVVVCATSDEPPLLRIRAALAASTIAEYFRDAGRDVLLIMDSVTRLAHAQRQVGLAVGEPPATKGYTPSVFALLPQLLERAGTIEGAGSITALYSILVDGDDMTEPIADAARGILDGHVILARSLAQRGHFPAIDVLDSVSRVADDVTDREHQSARRELLAHLAAYKQVEDLIQIGAYAKGSNKKADAAETNMAEILQILRQSRGDATSFPKAREQLLTLAAKLAQSPPASRTQKK